MARINTNIASQIAQFNLGRANVELETRLQRLSTGLRINRGADDPAGLIISERIATDIAGTEQAIRNGERASSVIATTDAALNEVTGLLNSIKALLVEAANTGGNSPAERDANQLQIDSAIQSITRISSTATFGGLRLLDGSQDYILSGVTQSTISRSQIFGASFIGSDRVGVEVDVLESAQRGQLYLAGNNPILNSGTLVSAITLEIGGIRGVSEFTFASGSTTQQIIDAINARASLTGVQAVLVDGEATSGIVLQSVEYGSSEFVSVQRVNAGPEAINIEFLKHPNNAPVPGADPLADFDFSTLVVANRDEGKDVLALVNGSVASGDGLNISLNTPQLSLRLLLNESFAIDPTLTPSTFDILGGGSTFQLGPEVNAAQQANIGVPSIAASRLGGVLVNGGLQFLSSLLEGGPNSIDASVQRNDFSTASDIIDQAIDDITILRGRLGAFERNVLETNRRSLESAVENLAASRSLILDADFAAETSALTRAQVLQSSTTSILQLANTQSQSVLQLLG